MEHVTEGSWESLPVPLHPRVLGVLRELGFPYMTPVQVAEAGEVGPRCAGRSWGRGGSGRARQPLNWMRPVGVRTRILEFLLLRLGLLPRLSAAPTRVMPSWLMIARQRRQGAAHLCQGLHRPPTPPLGAGTQVPGSYSPPTPSSCETLGKWLNLSVFHFLSL